MKKTGLPIRVTLFHVKAILLQCLLTTTLAVASFANNAKGQDVLNKKLTLSIKNEQLKNVLRKISKEGAIKFSYTRNTIPENESISLAAKEETLADILHNLLKPYNISFTVIGSQVVLKKTVEPPVPGHKQLPAGEVVPRPIKGAIKDAKSKGIEGVNILVKGTRKGAMTAADGSFTIDANNGDVLECSIVGYKTFTFIVGDQTDISIRMEEDVTGLEEVVMVGYSAQKKVNLTGATDGITARQLESRPIQNLGSGLQGLIGNLNITTSNGRPNTASSLNIRGQVSLNGGAPLILVDNIAVTENELARINPTDVESVTVLKDASAAAIYGARASFGVILINTKSAKNSKLDVNVNAYTSVRTVGKLPELVTDPYTSITLKNQAAFPLYNPAWPANLVEYAKKRSEDPSQPDVIVNPNDASKYLYMGSTDWMKEGYNSTAPSEEINLNLSQKTEKLGYYFSAGYYHQDGMVRFNADSYKRYNMRGKVNFTPTRWLTFANNTSFANVLYTSPTYLDGNYFWNLNRLPSFSVPKNPDGSWTQDGANQLGSIREGGRSDSKLNDFQSTFSFSANLLKDVWTVKGDATFRRTSSIERRFEKPIPYRDGPNGPIKYAGTASGTATDNMANVNYNVYNLYTEAHKKFGQHNVGLLAGFNQEERLTTNNSASRNGIISYNLPTVNLSTGTMNVTERIREWAVQGFFGRFNYNYDGRYLLELDGRYDGSSRFRSNDRWGFFPSASAGWVISEEAFLKPLTEKIGMDFFKVRASYGSLGNQGSAVDQNGNGNEYGYIPTMTFTPQIGQILGTSQPPTVNPPGAISPSYTWEKVKTINVGADFQFLANRLEISFDQYTRRVQGMLAPGKTLPSVFGTAVPLVNAGDLKTQGFELKLSWRDRGTLAGSDFNYNVTVSLADSRAWITKYDNPTKSLGGNFEAYYEGRELGELWGMDVEGFFKTADEAKEKDYTAVGEDDNGYQFYAGDIKFADRNKDNKVNFGKSTVDDPGDMRKIGNTRARLPYSIDLSGSWKGFDARIFFQGIGKRDWYPGASNIYFWGIYAQPWTNVTKQNLDRWTPDNPNGYFPRIKAYSAEDNMHELGLPNTKYLQDASYLRCKNLTIGYTLPASLLRRAKINRIRFYASAENLFEVSHIKVKLDPEGLNGDIYPFQRTYAFGMNLNF
ncbi:TonB-dependent receptor [Paraflavitalea sp. CAU 1676]|uniref:TonB-dependent receptor n=1 Tax=Paraflavitalea sp. CAU 1676 TaxID=3032598 RepID=UPI0023DA40BF|nr:TonB-dependent receptor [Paraflavitalea sp. CAU 1676]MDF2191506.1 TonB-dependent receptor [Paraflavitalea sp. CAU 1676]